MGGMDERYARHLVMPEIGEAGQRRLSAARVFVVGAGGLGSPILLYLAAAGVGTLGIADADKVAASNLNRQILYTTEDLGRSKAVTAVQRVRALNPSVKAIPHEVRVLRENGLQLVREYDLVVEASDNLETKALMNELCVDAGIPLVWGAVARWEGQMGTYVPGHACRACIFPEVPKPGTYPTPAELGVVGAASGVMGALEAVQALQVLLGAGELLVDQLLLWDGLHMSFDIVSFERNPHCPVCGGEGVT
ncbi:MAG: HesA/MoeB/ThiF family protein [Anaerolineae bacterium]|nr:HesA/MoeB/ThiF family protein [Anaerolineae bacterium]